VRQIEVDALRRLQSHLMDDRPSRFFRDKSSDADGESRRAKAS